MKCFLLTKNPSMRAHPKCDSYFSNHENEKKNLFIGSMPFLFENLLSADQELMMLIKSLLGFMGKH